MTSFTTAEIEDAFAAHVAKVVEIRTSQQWSRFADLFTEDVEYVEHAFGEFHGRDEVAAWAARTMGAYPGNVMTDFPIAWHVVDQPTARVICEIRNLMPALGDDEPMECSNLTILTYAGDGLWSRVEDVYNPAKFLELGLAWARAAQARGELPQDAATFLERFGG